MLPKRENAVRSLTSLYTIVIGVALSLAIFQLFGEEGGLRFIEAHSVFLFLSLVVTLIPFYHGALRHIDDVYIENANKHIQDGALVVDVLLLFFHGLVFVVLALLIDYPNQFVWVFMVLIGVDVAWGLFAHFGASTKSTEAAEGKWLFLNLLFVLIGIATLVVLGVDIFSIEDESLKIALPLFAASFIRTIIDYIWCWNFYLPQDETMPE